MRAHTTWRRALTVGPGALLLVAALWGARAGAVPPTAADLGTLPPDAASLPGFVRQMPSGETATASGAPGPDLSIDRIRLNTPLASYSARLAGSFDSVVREFYTPDGRQFLYCRVCLADSAATAKAYFDLQASGAEVPKPGAYCGLPAVGDESNYIRGSSPAMEFRCGRATVVAWGGVTRVGRNQGAPVDPPSPEMVEALAHTALLRLARRPDLSGIQATVIRLTANGTALSAAGLQVGSVVYAPVLPIVRAAVWAVRWDAAAGTLLLAKAAHPSASLNVLSASVNGGADSLKVPVFLDGGQPMMALDDLVRLTGATATRQGDGVDLRL